MFSIVHRVEVPAQRERQLLPRHRAFDYAELGLARRALEVSSEVRYPVLGRPIYAFYDYVTDLNSSKEVRGNPTEYFHKLG